MPQDKPKTKMVPIEDLLVDLIEEGAFPHADSKPAVIPAKKQRERIQEDDDEQ